jgi:hypothetical protein
LRRVAGSEPDPDEIAPDEGVLDGVPRGAIAHEGVDWDGVIAEIRSVGVAELNAIRILLRQAMLLLLQIRGWPEHEGRIAWLLDLGGVLADLAIRATPGARPLLELEPLYQAARGQLAGITLEGQLPRGFPLACPFTLDDLLRGDRGELDALLAPNEEL